MKRALVACFLFIGLAGCGGFGNGTGILNPGGIFGQSDSAEAGLPYRAVLKREDDRRNFTVRVRAGGVSVPDVRESVRFPATRYCLTTYGGSDVRWEIDPATGDWAFSREGDDMIFRGRCLAR